MRVSDLARTTGLSVATVKFYLREGLLPAGTPTARNQAWYGDAHVRRIRLIRTLVGVGRIDLASVRAVLAAVDDERTGFDGVLEVLNRASYCHDTGVYGQADVASASHEVAEFIEAHGWSSVRSSAGEELTEILAALRGLGCDAGADIFTPFAAAAKMVITAELEMAEPGDEQEQKGLAVMRYILFEAAFAAMRRLCGEAMASLRFSGAATAR